ncbi:SusC/RagA family TonB-linked outer membrane protein [Ferruginibacter albus]|uniref:SusC/RagA family TonB-linked outer membrane protein n=1 Tax=Ferruginibacter albus TaxID=2875540 RepID=UPI001CC592D6|nr:TonB-dependent receptor [Ferruginibacter albus]UAY51874.1 TonB-dependent receptor [Ferruginibacter albus]
MIFRTKIFLSLIFCLQVLHVSAQDISISGKVTDDKGQPLANVSIIIVSGKKGTSTDNSGNFQLRVKDGTSLSFSFVGYDAVTMPAQLNMQVTLKKTDLTLTDVVVIGYGTQKKKEVTGAISTVKSSEFQKGAITTPEQLIAGKVAGVTITSNGGSPGAGSIIRIRGGASLNASNDPLIVIDGVPLSGNNIYGTSNSLSLINPNDIESFTILKDAASCAIYGSRASNGVIMITTKKGTGRKPVITFNTQVSYSTLANKVDVMSAGQFTAYVDSFGSARFKNLLGKSNTDWQDEIYHNVISTDNNISIAGRYKNIPYRISAGFLNQNGLLLTDYLERGSGGISLSPQLFDNHLKIDINLKGAISKARFGNGAAISSAIYFDPTQPVRTNSPFGNYFEWSDLDPITQQLTLNKLAPKNPVELLNLYRNISHVQRSYGNIQFDYKFHFLPDLHANLNLGYDVASGRGNIDVPAYAAQNYLDSGQRNRYSNSIGNKVGEFYLNYVKDLKKIKSNINLIAGYGYYNNLSTNYNYPNVRYNGDTIPNTIPAFAFDKPENTLISYYSRLIYTYNEKYILAASIRRDGSSKFSPANRWGVFPSVALTWRINNEEFLKNQHTLSDLKLRLSYGVTGNQDGINNYPYQAVYSSPGDSTSFVQFGNSFYGMSTPTAYDANIKWEQTTSTNIGIDFGFLNSRITGSIDYYFRKTKDLLNLVPLPAGSNFTTSIVTNVGNVENSGVEFSINADIIRNKKYNWSVSFNASYYDNKITNLTATNDPSYAGTTIDEGGGIKINSVGYSAQSFYVYKQEFSNGKAIEGLYADANGDGVFNDKDFYHYKSPTPTYVMGFSTQFTYGKWTASTVLRANIGNYMYNYVATGATQASIFNSLGFLANNLTSINNTSFLYTQAKSDYYIQNASFLKMDNLGISYALGKILKDKANVQISANCQNVFTITKYTGLDPEKFNGIDDNLYPRPRTFVLGVNLQF